MTSRCRICGSADAQENLCEVILASGEVARAHINCFHQHHGQRAAELVKAARKARDWGGKEEPERTP